jgi:hypothetical protein
MDGYEEHQGAEWAGHPPMAWAAEYTGDLVNESDAELVVANCMDTGLYVFDLHAEEQPIYRDFEEAVDFNRDGELQEYERRYAMRMWARGETVPNTGPAGNNRKMGWDDVRDVWHA